ncbi:MAG: inner membrane protein ypdA [Pseudomonadota bacterium]|jgi:two-component system sensor histidine kinase AlgZ
MTQDSERGRSGAGAGEGAGSRRPGIPARRRSDGMLAPVLPECCNPAVGVRVLFVLNAGAVVAALVQASAGEPLWPLLASIFLLLEPCALVSIAVLCGLRRTVLRRAAWLQWLVGVTVPMTATVLVSAALSSLLLHGVDGGAAVAWVTGRALLAAAVAAVLLEYLRLRTLALSPSLAEARLQALQARIRPHFLFNSLNTVLALLRTQQRRAEETLENLADLFRVFMRDTRDMVAIGEEVEVCRKYLEIEKLRLGERLSVEWELATMPGDALVPSLLLQPLVENAVHHGVEPSARPGRVSISVRQVGERVVVEIVNTLDPESRLRPGNQMGLSNVRERLLLLYDSDAAVKTAVREDRFRILLEFPCRKERRRRGVPPPLDPDRR